MFIPKLYKSIVLLLCVFTQMNSAFAALSSTCNENTPGQMTNRFTDLGDGNILDSVTKLIWGRCNLGQSWNKESQSCKSFSARKNWRESLNDIKNFNDNQFVNGLPDDWRMPNIKELATIIDLSCHYYAINTEIFTNAESAYWSSTPDATNLHSIPIVDEDNVVTGYQDENLIWTISTLTGTEEAKALSTLISTILVRGPTAP